MNAAILFTIQGSIEEIEKKVGGDFSRVSEFLILQKYSERFDRVFVFSDDQKNCSHFLSENAHHIRLHNPLVYVALGWMVLLYYTLKYKLRAVHLVGSPALPMTFLLNKLTPAKVILDYNYLWYNSYVKDTGSGIKNNLRKNNLTARLVEELEKIMVNNFVDFIMLGTEEARKVIKDQEKIMPIKKGIIMKNFNPLEVEKHPVYKEIDGKTIVFTGRLVPMKDPITLIKGFNRAKRKMDNIHLIVCGNGPLEDECKELAGENVHFMGFVDNIPAVLKGADVYVQPSAYDPSPRSLLEAMAMGKACIATNVGGVESYLKGHGILIGPGNPDIMAEKIVYLLENPDVAKDLGVKARNKMLEEHDLGKNIEKELEIIKK